MERTSRPPVSAPARLAARGAAAFLLCALASGCRTLPPAAPAAACAATDRAMVHDTLYFGRHRPDGGRVDDAQWRAFLDDTVTPRFPEGLTVVSATGQWRGADGRIEREPSEVVSILHDGGDAAKRAVEEIAEEYKRRFAQEAVLRERRGGCARF